MSETVAQARPGLVVWALIGISLGFTLIMGCGTSLRQPSVATRTLSLTIPADPPLSTPTVAQTQPVGIANTTATPASTVTPSPSVTREPTPTSYPALDIESVDLHTLLVDGDYAAALRFYEMDNSLAQSPALRIALARAYRAEGRHSEALALLAPISDWAEAPQERAQALALIAAIHEEKGAWQAAIEALAQYLALEPAAAPYVEWRIAKALEALGRDDEAAGQLAAVELDRLTAAFQAEVLEELAAVQKRMGQPEQALETYERILGFARQESYRALVKYRRGEVLLELGRKDAAIEQYTAILSEHPQQRGAYLALQALDALEVPTLDDLARGKLLYHVGEYQAGLVALERYVLENAQGSLGEAYHYLALAHGRVGQYAQAFEAYDAVIQHYADYARIGDVWMDKARAAQRYGSDPSGIYYEFRRLYPRHSRAPEALWLGAKALEGEGEWERATEFYALLHANYPSSSWRAEARFREGLMAYAGGEGEQALVIWQDALEGTLAQQDRARVLTWAGLAARAQGDEALARTYWDEAANAAPDGYYGLRARDLAVEAIPRFASDVSIDIEQSQPESTPWDTVETWVRTWYTPTNESALDLSQDLLARRGFALLDLGWHTEGLEMLRQVRDRAGNDPLQLLGLMRVFDGRDLHALTISGATRLLWLGRRAAASEPPSALMALAYPTTYGHLVAAEAQRNAFDPYLFLAMIRQESRFDPEALSYAGARGLTQVMPATGKWIAESLGAQGFRSDLLERPVVAIHYGAWYLKTLLDLYERDWIAALVAYNAGPGNLSKWTDGQPIADHDLFYETLPSKQAQDYVRLIYEQYRAYQQAYAAPE